MVAHHEELFRLERPRLAALVRHVGGLVLEDVCLYKLLPVDVDVAAVDVDGVPAGADDPLDERCSRGVLGPTGRGVEDDDVAPMVVVEVVGELVHENVLIRHQCVLHGWLLYLIRLNDESLGDQENHQRQQDRFKQFEEATERSRAHKLGSIGAVLSSCPVELPTRLGWLKSGRFLRLLSVLAALAILAGVLYNAVMVDRIPPTYQITVSNTTSSGLAVTLTSIDVSFSEEVRRETAEDAFSLTESVPSVPAASAVPSIRATLVPTA